MVATWNGRSARGAHQRVGAAALARMPGDVPAVGLGVRDGHAEPGLGHVHPPVRVDLEPVRVPGGVRVGQQLRKGFGLTWRTFIGNDTEGTAYGYKINIVYEGTAAPSKRDSQTINDTPEMNTLSWDFDTTPVEIPGKDADGKPFRPSAKVTIDSTKVNKAKLKALEDILYGTDAVGAGTGTEPRLPLPAELFTLLGVTGG